MSRYTPFSDTKKLTAYGYAVSMIFIKEQNMIITQTDKCDTLVLYIHGKGGSAAEADHYKPLFPACHVIGLDYPPPHPGRSRRNSPQPSSGSPQDTARSS